MIDLYAISVGDLVILKDGRKGTCTENMEDGQWVEVEFDGDAELVHSQDIVQVNSSQNAI